MHSKQCSFPLLRPKLRISSFLVICSYLVSAGTAAIENVQTPYLIPLRRESVPVYRKDQIVSHKTSYSGLIRVGRPAQEFRVVFDTGSGHVVLPAIECASEACLVHKRYNMSSSQTAEPINLDGSPSPPDELCDQADITFGTGKLTGEFVRENVCLVHSGVSGQDDGEPSRVLPCANGLHIVMAVEMSVRPFKTFGFDGILGLGLAGLALNRDFSFFSSINEEGAFGEPRFATFLTQGEEGEESEIAFGGYNSERILEPLSWVPVARPELGYWQVDILAIRIGGVELDFCRDGSCRGVLDTGTSHLGIPAAHRATAEASLTRLAQDISDCRLMDGPDIEIELNSVNLTLHPRDYMRRMPSTNRTALSLAASKVDAAFTTDVSDQPAQRHCRPSMVSVNLPAPVGPNVFILGEPFLHRYYTVFDWKAQKIGLALAANQRNTARADDRSSRAEHSSFDSLV